MSIENRLAVLEAVLGINNHECHGDPDKCSTEMCERECPLRDSIVPIQTDSIRRLAENHIFTTTLITLMEQRGIIPSDLREQAHRQMSLNRDEATLQRLRVMVSKLRQTQIADVILAAPLARIVELESRIARTREEMDKSA